MKYIKAYEALTFYEVTKDKISKAINWHIIQDIKDMSLEYIDDGYVLRIVVIMQSPIGSVEYAYPVYCLFYDHGSADEEYDYVEKFNKVNINISKIRYRVNIFPRSEGFDYDRELSVELASRVMEAYPEINVII